MLYITEHFTKTNTKIVLKSMLWKKLGNASINTKPILRLYSDYQVFLETEDKAEK